MIKLQLEVIKGRTSAFPEGKAVYMDKHIRFIFPDKIDPQIPVVIIDAEPEATQLLRATEALDKLISETLSEAYK